MGRAESVSKWLAGARAQDGLLVPGRPDGRACDLLLTAGDVRVVAEDEVVRLRWEDLAPASTNAPGPAGSVKPQTGGMWHLGPWAVDENGGGHGGALLAFGSCADATTALRTRRPDLAGGSRRIAGPGQSLVLQRPRFSRHPALLDVYLLNRLCRVLRERPRWRARLDDPRRVQRLAEDLRARSYDVVLPNRGLRRRTWEIVTAMQALGYSHKWGGRPLPGDRVADVDEVVPAVLAKIRASPYAQELKVNEDDVRALAEKYYLLDPWPFAALAD